MFLRWMWIEETGCHTLLCFQGVVTWKFVSAHEKGDSLISTKEHRPLFHLRIDLYEILKPWLTLKPVIISIILYNPAWKTHGLLNKYHVFTGSSIVWTLLKVKVFAFLQRSFFLLKWESLVCVCREGLQKVWDIHVKTISCFLYIRLSAIFSSFTLKQTHIPPVNVPGKVKPFHL